MRRAAGARGAGVALISAVAAASAAFVGCGKLQGFGGPSPPLVTFQFAVTGDLAPLLPPGETSPRSLQVALVWGAQWLTEPFCILPPANADAAAVVAVGCRDPFAFVPARVAANVPVSIGETASMSLFDLPGTDVMVGDITSRVAYGSFVVYDDRDGSGTLELAVPHRTRSGGNMGPPQPIDTGDSPDVVYGASFVTMTAPDQRVAFSEGTFNSASAFYPRGGCDPPPSARFSILGAGGFSATDPALATGGVPVEDPAGCHQWAPSDVVVTFGVQQPASVQEVSCVQRSDDSSIRYREPPSDAPNFSGRVTACAPLPSFDDGNQPTLIQLVVSGRTTDRCKGLTHYTLRGCRENVACPVPDWDYTTTPPAWWPCPR